MALYEILNTTDLFDVFNYTSSTTCLDVANPESCGAFGLFLLFAIFMIIFISTKSRASFGTSLTLGTSVSLVASLFMAFAWNMIPDWMFSLFLILFIGSAMLLFTERR